MRKFRQWTLLEAVSSPWKHKKIHMVFAWGDPQDVPAVVRDGWAVHREPRARGKLGSSWVVTHVASSVKVAGGFKTQKYAKQLVDDMLGRFPALVGVTDIDDIEPYARQIGKLVQDYLRGRVPETTKVARSAPSRGRRDTERLRRLAKMGDPEAVAELQRLQVRAGQRKAAPTARVSDIRPHIRAEFGKHLQSLGQRSGKAGDFYGRRNHSRAVSVGRNTVLVNVQQVSIKHYPSLGGRPRISTSWTLHREYPIKEITDADIAKIIAWVKKARPTTELRQEVRDLLAATLKKDPGRTESVYEVVYG